MQQIPFNLRPRPKPGFADFHISPGNAAAVSMLRARERWTAPTLLLLGPSGSGKTHLGRAWQLRYRGEFLDDAHLHAEPALFDAINRALAGQSTGLLLASPLPPTEWGVEMPDLNSRLKAIPTITLAEHDEATLEPILRELFSQAGRQVGADVVEFVLNNADRSIDSLRDLVQDLDVAAGSAKVDLTKRFVARFLKDRSEIDLFAGPVE